jgi:cyclic beta-1,2-glucan synthetase
VRRWQRARSALAAALDREAWDGRWYRRAYFDDGSPLGSAANAECRIDLIAQAWAALSGAGDLPRAAQAMDSARALLWDPATGLMRLLHPPLAHARPDAGYIQAYPPGIRENGGQYNHGAVWALMAFAQQGDAEWVWRMFEALSPAHRSLHPRLGPAYALEPYAIAGDIYSQPPWAGRGGWSWYTGAASWLQRAALESICGLHVRGRLLTLNPCLPPHWPRAELQLRRNGRVHRIELTRDEARLRQLQADAPAARVVRAGETLDLDALGEGQPLLMLVADAAPTPPAPALARPLPQPAD